jgi:hypothetical protein
MALVCERTIPTERPPPVGEVSADFSGERGCRLVRAADPHGRKNGIIDNIKKDCVI